MKEQGMNSVGERLAKLDTLGTGIVYDKDVAWERLQGRMQPKPVYRLQMVYKMAAALLLICLCIGTTYLLNRKPVLVVKNNPAQKTQPKMVTIAATSELPVVENIAPAAKPVANRSAIKPVAENNTISIPSAIIKQAPQPVVIENQHMLQPEPVLVEAPPKMDIKNMKVVHINDVMEEERDVARTGKEQQHRDRIAITLPFLHAAESSQPITQAYDSKTNHKLLQINLSN